MSDIPSLKFLIGVIPTPLLFQKSESYPILDKWTTCFDQCQRPLFSQKCTSHRGFFNQLNRWLYFWCRFDWLWEKSHRKSQSIKSDKDYFFILGVLVWELMWLKGIEEGEVLPLSFEQMLLGSRYTAVHPTNISSLHVRRHRFRQESDLHTESNFSLVSCSFEMSHIKSVGWNVIVCWPHKLRKSKLEIFSLFPTCLHGHILAAWWSIWEI